jgi:eukaryotic-like serine/threonine-protein kinase
LKKNIAKKNTAKKSIIGKYITGRPLWVNLFVALALIFILGLIFLTSLDWITQHGVARTVPSVTGKKLDNVVSLLEEKGFDVVVQDSVFYDSLQPSVIIKQVPEPDAVVKVNRTVYVTINRFVPPDVDMPNLVGYSFRNAEMVLKNLGLKLGDTTQRPDFAKNSVLEQTYKGNKIEPGAKVKVGTPIALVIGSGIGVDDMAVPKLVGLTLAEARILLDAQGLILGPVIPSPMVRDNESAYVVRQSPSPKNEAGRQFRIRPGQMVDVWLDVEPPVTDSATNTGNKPQTDE